MKVALLTTDSRELYKQYEKTEPAFGTAPEALLQGFAMLPEVEVHVVTYTRIPMQSPQKLAPNIFFHSLLVPKLGWMRTLYQGCVLATRKKMRELQPDIVHGQGTELNCGISAVFSGFPNVITIHGNMKAMAELEGAKPGDFHWIAAKLETVALKKTGGVFCNSGYTEELVRPRAKKTWRVANPIREAFLGQLPPEKLRAVPVLLNVGIVQPRKRQPEMLAALRNLHRRGLKFEIQFAGMLSGKEDYVAQFKRLFAEAEQAGYARHLGILNTAQLINAMDSASALVHFPNEEAFGLVVAEALARNLKFFGTAVGGILEIATGVEGAELLSLEDWTGVENAIARWIEGGHARPVSAAAVMRERYHPKVIAQRHLEIYRELMAGREKRN